MSIIDDIKADAAKAIAAGEAIGADIASRLMTEVGHNATAAIGHIIDIVTAHQLEVRSMVQDVMADVLAAIRKIEADVSAALPPAPPAPPIGDTTRGDADGLVAGLVAQAGAPAA